MSTRSGERHVPRRHRPALRRALLVAAGLSLLLTACGTTVPLAQQGTNASSGLPGDASGASNGMSAGSGSTGGSSASGSGANTPSTRPAAGTSGQLPASSSGGSLQGAGAQAPLGTGAGLGVTTQSINIGFEVSDADAAFKALGFGNLTTGNTRNQVEALVSYINSHGGLAGRKINPVLYQVPTASTGDNPQTECAYYTQDHKVFAVIGAGAASSLDLFTCLAKAHTIYIDGYGSLNQAAAKSLRGYWYDPADFVLDRFAQLYVDQLVALGFFSLQAKIGLLSYDDPRFRDVVDRVVKPALAAHGLKIADEADYSTSNYASQSSGFVLKFHADGITHVLNLVAGVVVFFQESAENQQYRPRYALSSRDGPGSFIQVLSPAAQLKSAIGIGWQPFADVDVAHNPGDVSPNQALCRQIMKKAGEDMTNGGVLVTTGRYCETSFFLRAALAQAIAVSPSGLLAAVGQLGNSYPPVTTFQTYFNQTRPDGPAQIRPFAYDTTCSCFHYTGPKRTLPH